MRPISLLAFVLTGTLEVTLLRSSQVMQWDAR